MMTNKLLIEASLFGYDTFFDTADYTDTLRLLPGPAVNAPDRGWTPLNVPGLIDQGVNLGDLTPFIPADSPIAGATITTAAHFYVGPLEGKQTVVLAYRSTDEGGPEFAFQGAQLPPNPFGAEYGWDLYYLLHAQASAAALSYAMTPTNGVEQVLITGHSLGGIIAELTATRLMGEGEPFADLAPATLVATFGSPGSTESAGNLNQLNIVHTDDFVARLSDLSPLFLAGGATREGLDILIERPEATLPDFQPEDLDTVGELFAALLDPALKIEHQIDLYIDSAALLDSAEEFVPVVKDATDDPFRWLLAELDQAIVGTDSRDSLSGGDGHDLIFARGGQDLAFGQSGDDVLIASGGNNFMQGGLGDDVLVGASGNDFLQGGGGNDRFYPGGGNNIVDGGPGIDAAVFDGARDDFLVSAFGSFATVSQSGPTPSRTIASNVEFLEFDDVTLALEGGKLTPVAPSLVASVSVDDLVITSDVA